MRISKDGFHDVLTIIETTVELNTMHVVVSDGCHLQFLQRTHATLGIHNKDVDIFLSANTIYRRATGIATSRTQNIQALASLTKHVFKQLAQKLQSHIFESQSRTMKKLKHGYSIKILQSDHVRMAERSIGFCD